MIIFCAMIVPFVTAGVLWMLFKHRTTWWEFAIPFVASFLFAIALKAIVSRSICSDTEYWTGWIERAEYFEDWKETVVYYEEVADGTESYTDASGNRATRTKYKRVRRTRTDYHPEYYIAKDSNGREFSITEREYNSFLSRFGNKTFKDLHRDYCCWDDGDCWITTWPGTDETMEVSTTTHLYLNKVAHSNSVFNFPKVDPQEYGLFEYPKIEGTWTCPSILGDGGPTQYVANRLLNRWNAKLGASKQVRMWILVFEGKPLDAAFDQEAYWKGSNKNEIVLCVGINGRDEVQWGHVFSWTEREDLKVDLRNYIASMEGQSIDLVSIADTMRTKVQEQWERKDWSKFNYISVDPPMLYVVLCFVLTCLLNGGISFWLIHNEFQDHNAIRRF